MVSFRGQKKKGLRLDRSPLGVLLKINDEHPTPFMFGDPPPPGNKPYRSKKIASSKKFC